MSATLKTAEATAAAIVKAWRLDPVQIAGGIRRRCPQVERVVLVVTAAPVPAGPGMHDALYANIKPFVGESVRVISGFGRRFTLAKFEVVGASGATLAVEVRRADPGNMGWTMIEATGPDRFADAVLRRWRRVMELPDAQPALAGYDEPGLRDAKGQWIAVYSEQELLELVGMPWVEPADRASQDASTTEAA